MTYLESRNVREEWDCGDEEKDEELHCGGLSVWSWYVHGVVCIGCLLGEEERGRLRLCMYLRNNEYGNV